MSLPEFNTPFLNDYMKLVEDTESPRLFHIWSAISGAAAALGRRCFLPFGPTTYYPNHYVLLVGTPASRKSTAINIMRKQLAASTSVRFGPSDTGGQRQGIVEAMRGKDQESEFLDNVEVGFGEHALLNLGVEDIARITNEPDFDQGIVTAKDKNTLFFAASEFTKLIGQNNLSMIDFLTTMYDGDDYDYQIKAGKTTLKDPLIGMVAGTTPQSLSLSMPPAAGGQGILSRIILVYGSRKYKLVPRPEEFDPDLVRKIREGFNRAYLEVNGEFTETDDARSYSETLYDIALGINDPRFGYYHERRYAHLIKLAMTLAGLRGSTTIVKDDYLEAHRLLKATEKGMPDALGQFGMNPLAALKQGILDYLRQQGVISIEHLRAAFHRDARAQEFSEAYNDLVKTHHITSFQQTDGTMNVAARVHKEDIEDSMFKALSES